MIQATLSKADQYGRATIEAEGITIASSYPLNRLCKALMMIGLSGPIDCYGPTGLRMTAIVEKYGKRRLSELKELRLAHGRALLRRCGCAGS
jgi:hypothetical protein